MIKMHAYFASLSAGRIALWCYLIWYLVFATLYFDSSPRLWLTSIGLSAVIGTAYVISVHASGGVRQTRWQVFRLFFIPFCVSSFSALVKNQGFILIFSPKPAQDGLAISLCLAFLTFVALQHRARPGHIPVHEPSSSSQSPTDPFQ